MTVEELIANKQWPKGGMAELRAAFVEHLPSIGVLFAPLSNEVIWNIVVRYHPQRCKALEYVVEERTHTHWHQVFNSSEDLVSEGLLQG